jgi:hypothetical protein
MSRTLRLTPRFNRQEIEDIKATAQIGHESTDTFLRRIILRSVILEKKIVGVLD